MSRNRFLTRVGLVALALVLALGALLIWQQARLLHVHDAHVREQQRATQRAIENQHRAALQKRAEFVASDPAFAGYVEQAMGGALPGMDIDTTSIVDLLRERQSQHGLAASAVLDRNGRVVASTVELGRAGTLEGDPLFARAQTDLTVVTGVREQAEGLLHVAVLPLAAVGVSEGFLLVGMPLDLRFAQEIAAAGGGDVLLRHADSGRVVASTLGGAPAAILQALAQPGDAAPAQVLVGDADRPVTVLPLLDSDRARLVLLASAAPREALIGALRTTWLVAVAVLLLVLAAVAWLIWRSVLKPAAAIADCLDRAGAGDFRLQMPMAAAGSLAPLAHAFNRLMARLST
ncbi:hypothetical protein [Cognatilysobacter bugurensis]|uniref:HAMP domain-containing protein n=1 Tax=Cognatilysobacter bugurensis TaxID=543356 RepID=A0A918W4M8_9GAMM|nr:hypothetical protein [Lysobacter bugurensis]GHA72048.1 hypothetical protein GCM10007067_05630 [Lysobacter bugurensis]